MRNIYGVMDNQGGSFKDFFLHNNMPKIIADLKEGLDINSIKIIDKCLDRMLHFPDLSRHHLYFIDENVFTNFIESPEEKFYRELYEAKLPYFKRTYNLLGESYNPDTFLFEHGLFFSNSKIKKYIENKYFIDGGAYIGDSVLVLKKYNPKKILSFDLSKRNVDRYSEVLRANDIPREIYSIYQKGISNKSESLTFNDTSDQGASLCYKGTNTIDTVSIDFVRDSLDNKIGFIKADIEGYGLKALEGMKKTISLDRPVLALSIYHTPDEFFYMKPLLAKITENIDYKIEISHFHCFYDFLVDITLFAYPRELAGLDDVDVQLGKVVHHPAVNVIRDILNI